MSNSDEKKKIQKDFRKIRVSLMVHFGVSKLKAQELICTCYEANPSFDASRVFRRIMASKKQILCLLGGGNPIPVNFFLLRRCEKVDVIRTAKYDFTGILSNERLFGKGINSSGLRY